VITGAQRTTVAALSPGTVSIHVTAETLPQSDRGGVRFQKEQQPAREVFAINLTVLRVDLVPRHRASPFFNASCQPTKSFDGVPCVATLQIQSAD
jgi:hypothetical protein